MNKTNWEKETCSRCGGTGKYSSHILYGRTCFKCKGAKIVFTKRGLAAKKYYIESLKVDVTEIKLGDHIWEEDGWYTVQEIIKNGTRTSFRIGPEYIANPYETVIRCPQDENGKSCNKALGKKVAEAHEYQAKLGKHGKVLKKYLDVK